MSGWLAFFDMGGYAAFVWPAYGVSVVALIVLAAVSWREMKRSERIVDLGEKADRTDH